jgi:hypothetical protein
MDWIFHNMRKGGEKFRWERIAMKEIWDIVLTNKSDKQPNLLTYNFKSHKAKIYNFIRSAAQRKLNMHKNTKTTPITCLIQLDDKKELVFSVIPEMHCDLRHCHCTTCHKTYTASVPHNGTCCNSPVSVGKLKGTDQKQETQADIVSFYLKHKSIITRNEDEEMYDKNLTEYTTKLLENRLAKQEL